MFHPYDASGGYAHGFFLANNETMRNQRTAWGQPHTLKNFARSAVGCEGVLKPRMFGRLLTEVGGLHDVPLCLAHNAKRNRFYVLTDDTKVLPVMHKDDLLAFPQADPTKCLPTGNGIVQIWEFMAESVSEFNKFIR